LLKTIIAWDPNAVHYEGEVVTYLGACWQSVRDTGKEPGQSGDWQLVVAAGESGRSMKMRGTYNPAEQYEALDVVSLDRSWFVARHDRPGICPGPDWQGGPSGKKGDKGLPGERGPQGVPGKDGTPAPEWVAVKIDRASYSLTAVMSDGSDGPTFSVRELFDQYDFERKGA
jgi:hypothetical protein